MSTSVKLQNFVEEPVGEKPVTDVAGVGPAIGQRLVDKGYDKAYQLIAQYLLFKKDDEMFLNWLKDEAQSNAKFSADTLAAVKGNIENFM